MKPIQLTIPTPCHESWDKMTPKDQGRFCASCSKVVVDFSAMSDAQLLRYFENLKTENVCGRVYPDQLNRSLEPAMVMQPRKKIAWFWQVAAAFTLFFFKGQVVKAQGKVAVTDTTKKIKEINDMPIRLGGIRMVHPDTVAKLPAKLTQIFITDENKKAVPYASVQLLPAGNWIAADSMGKINLELYHAITELKVMALGYEERQVALNDLPGNNVSIKTDFKLLEDIEVKGVFSDVKVCRTSSTQLTGMAGGISVKRTEGINSTASTNLTITASAGSVSVFPNPASKGQYVSMNIATKRPAEYNLLISDINGKKMLQQNITVVSKMQPIRLMVPANWASGQYYISIRSAKEQTLQTAAMLIL